MNPHSLLASVIGLGLLAAGSGFAQTTPAPAAPALTVVKPKGLGLKEGDRFIFIGDSITHGCLYSQLVENFFYTRHPNVRLHFRNAGVSGDKAKDVLNRFEEDVVPFKPTIATILLGMNDGLYKDFDQAAFDTYAKGMTEIMDRLDAMKCRVVVMSPTMFDHQAWDEKIKVDTNYAKGRVPTNYNAVLAYYGKWLQETARVRGYEFVDLFSTLNTLTVENRRQDPKFTLIPDAIHPGMDGSLVMAYNLLDQVGELGDIFSSGVKVAGDHWASLDPAVVTDVSGEPGVKASYTVQPKSLPWAVNWDAALASRLLDVGHSAYEEAHIVTGLKSGHYDLRINGQYVGTWDESVFARQAEIEEVPQSPTFQQAQTVIALNRKRNDEAVRPMRGLWGKQKGMLNKLASGKPEDKAAYDAWQVEFKAKRAELDALAAKYEEDIYKANQLKPLKVEVVPAGQPGAIPAPAPAAAPAAQKKAA